MNAPQRKEVRIQTSPLADILAGDAGGVLLVVGKSEETAKRIESFLRNAGHPLRCGWTDDADEMADVLQRAPPDVLLLEDGAAGLDTDQLLARASELRPDLPALLLSSTLDVADAAKAHARDSLAES